MNNVRAGRLHVLTLDAGTSSLRAQVWGVDGRPLPEIGARAHYRLWTDPEGGAWLEPEEVLSAVSEALDETVARAESRDARIAAVALDTLSPTLLGVDEQGRPLTPIYTYADTRSRRAAADLRQRLDPAEVHERTGCPIHSSYLPSRLPLAGTEPSPALLPSRPLDDSGRVSLFAILSDLRCELFRGLLERPPEPTPPGLGRVLDFAPPDPEDSALAASRLHGNRSRDCVIPGLGAGRPWLESPGSRRWETEPPPTWAAAAYDRTGWPSPSAPPGRSGRSWIVLPPPFLRVSGAIWSMPAGPSWEEPPPRGAASSRG